MRTYKISTRSFVALVLGATALIAAACGGNGDTNPTPTGTGGSSGAVMPVTSTTTSGTTSDTSTTSGSTSTTSGGGGCFMGTPMSNDDYLNACNGLTCQPVDNSTAKLPLIHTDGSLPPLPN